MPTITHLGHYEVTETLLETASVSVYFASMSWGDGQQSTVVLKAFDRSALPQGLAEADLHSGISRYRALVGETLVRLLDVFETPERVVLVLEHVDGLGLDTLLARLAVVKMVLDDEAVLYLMSRVFAGLAIAHDAVTPDTHDRAPIVHGEVQPSSIVLAPDGRVCVGEFPLTTFVASWRSILTTKDRITSAHLAPEQITRGVATVRSDIYSATLVLWELLAKRSYADAAASDLDRMVHLAEPDVTPLERIRPDVDARVLDVVRRGLVVSEALRTPTASDIAHVLSLSVASDLGRVKLRQAIARAVDISKPLGQASFAVLRTSMAPPSLSIVSTRRNDVQPLGPVGRAEDVPAAAISFSGLDVAGSALSNSSLGDVSGPPSESWFGGADSSRSGAAIPLPDYSNVSLGNPEDSTPGLGAPPSSKRWWIAGGIAALAAFPALGALTGWSYKRSTMRVTTVVVDPGAGVIATAPMLPLDAGVPVASVGVVPELVHAGLSSSATAALSTAAWAKGFRVFVDGAVVGETPGVFEIKCGTHRIKVGSAGVQKTVTVACGTTYAPTRP